MKSTVLMASLGKRLRFKGSVSSTSRDGNACVEGVIASDGRTYLDHAWVRLPGAVFGRTVEFEGWLNSYERLDGTVGIGPTVIDNVSYV